MEEGKKVPDAHLNLLESDFLCLKMHRSHSGLNRNGICLHSESACILTIGFFK